MAEKTRTFKLGYKTSRNNSRNGGARVFLCCHPDDRESWTEEISADIFKTNDCVIYYGVETDSLAETDTELTEDVLKEMRMFVVLLTTKFLTENNPARDIWFDIALENKIPLVLIVVEPDLDEVIQMSGYAEYQHLDRTSIDPTAIPYKDKLRRRLEQILIGSEAEEKVHNAFDGRMFLSYRKKDRSKAQSLMRMIHEIPSWADTAIWYDEYLIPGEKWEKKIDSALNECDMVALAVTSNLMEPNNYVIDYEIPNACGKGKDIVPMAVEELSSEKIDNFEGLVAPYKDSLNPADKLVNCYNDGTEEIEEALKGYIKESVIHGNRTPEHDYLIGLAYLNGIDMERNADAAVKRITASAERGLPDAMEKLADMYQTGDGVERDYEEAAKWLEELIKVRKQAYEESGSEEDGIRLIDAYINAGTVYFNIDHNKRAFEVLSECEDIAEMMLDRFMSVEIIYKLSKIYRDNGLLVMKAEQFSEAKKYYNKALEVSKILSKLNNDSNWMNIAVIYNDKGCIAIKEEKFDEARSCFKEACRVLGKVNVVRDSVIATKVAILVNWGDVETMSGKLAAAMRIYGEAAKVCEMENADADRCLHLGECYIRMGKVEYKNNNIEKAKKCLMKAIKQLTLSYQKTERLEVRYALSSCYRNMSIIEKEDISLEKFYLAMAIGFLEELDEKNDNFEQYRNLGDCWLDYGELSLQCDDLISAEKSIQKAVGIYKILLECGNCGSDKRHLIACYGGLGTIAYRKRKLSDAVEWYKKATECARKWRCEVGNDWYTRIVGSIYEDLEAIARTQNDLKSAKIWHDKALALENTLKQDKE